MSPVKLSGQLVCANDEEVAVVEQHLPLHKQLSRAESGCTMFVVRQTENPRVWQVDEAFADEAAFVAHQRRVANSAWGSATAGIERRYSVTS